MKLIVTGLIVSAFLFVCFFALLLLGLIKKRRKLILISLGILLLFITTTAWTGYNFLSKSYHKIASSFKPVTGEELYTVLFGKPEYSCIKMIHYREQILPRIDDPTRLEFTTCPEELKRILSLHKFEYRREPVKNIFVQEGIDNWFRPESLGDTVLVFKYFKDEGGNVQTIYTSTDSTKVFCVDIWD